MVEPFSNIEESFKNAFEHWEAPHSSAEMNAGWDKVANHLPQVPHTPSAGHAAGHVAGGAGKIIGIAGGIGATVVATVAILYNIYVKPAKPVLNEIGKSTTAIEQPKPGINQPSIKNRNNSATIAGNLNSANRVENHNSLVLQAPDISKDNNPGSLFNPLANNGFENGSKQNSTGSNTNNQIQSKPQSSKGDIQTMKLFLSDTVVCTGVPVSASSNISYPGVIIEWGDGNWNDFSGQNVHAYANPGTFRAHLTVDSLRVDRYITVLKTPKARFTVNQSEKLTCSFNNTSVNANRYSWNYGDGDGYETGFYASHTYHDTGRYEVRLVAMNQSGCTDTSVQYVNMRQSSEPGITSNVITPNGDGQNDDAGVTIEGETYFQLTIMDANGQKVFETTDKTKHWGGQNQFTGADCKAGTYYYTIAYSFNQNNASKTKMGILTLIRSKN